MKTMKDKVKYIIFKHKPIIAVADYDLRCEAKIGYIQQKNASCGKATMKILFDFLLNNKKLIVSKSVFISYF